MYICPMHKEVTSNKPGVCPKCGMTLIPVEKEESKMDHSMHNMQSSSISSWWNKF